MLHQHSRLVTHPGEAVEDIWHDQRLPQHEQQRWQHSREQRPRHVLLATIPAPVVPAALVTHSHCHIGHHTCTTVELIRRREKEKKRTTPVGVN